MYIERHIQRILKELKKQFPALLLTGARQVGKSTLLQHTVPQYKYLTFDDPLLLEQAKQEPRLFFLNHSHPLILDEVQYAPELFSLLKLEIDKQKQNGMFLLSGSQAFELMQNVSETLAGRIAILQLKGLSLREINKVEFYLPFIPNNDYLTKREQHLQSYNNVWEFIHKGDMPRLYEQETHWEVYYASYVSTYIERDVKQLINIQDSSQFTRFMVSIAARSGELLNYSSIAQEVGIAIDTVRRWTAITPETIQNGAKSGQFFETFVVSQIIKSFSNNGIEPPLYFYRDTNQKEIDIIIEYDRTLYPIEIKTTARPNKKMATSFKLLEKVSNDVTIGNGAIINQYPNKLWISDNLVSLPVEYI